ncbi:hypothetical protein D1007_20995 [Hordeum vulgare]|nr:hypothetical protein D1007_20995 [Hordeum vulgare]
MLGPIFHNETTAADQGGFVAILTNLTRHAFAMEEPPEYVLYQEHTSDAIRTFWAMVHIYTGVSPKSVPIGSLERQLPGREGYGRLLQVASGDHEIDPALLHLVRYLRAQEALYDQVTLNLLAAHEELARLYLRRRKVEPDASNPIVLFGRPAELLRSIPPTELNHAHISLEELRRILGISSNGTVATAPRNGHHRYPNLVDLRPSPSNCDVVLLANSNSTRPAHLDVNKVD